MWKGKCIFINWTLPGWQNTMLKFSAPPFLQGLFLGSPLGCILQQLEAGDLLQSPPRSCHGWWALPANHPGQHLRAFPAGSGVIPGSSIVPPRVRVLTDFSRANRSLGLLLGLLPFLGTTGISQAVMGFGDGHSHPHSWGEASSCWRARSWGAVSVRETPISSRWRNKLAN